MLPIEFSRISGTHAREQYLSLVIDPDHGTNVTVLYAMSAEETLEDAVRNLAEREAGSPEWTKNIRALASDGSSTPRNPYEETIWQWMGTKALDAVVWTDLKPNFKDELGVQFSNKVALDFLQQLRGEDAARAWEYIARAPAQTETHLRAFLRQDGRTNGEPPSGSRIASQPKVIL